MKTEKHVYEKVLDYENRKYAVHRALKGRRNLPKFKKYNEEASVENAYKWIVEYEPVHYKPIEIYDGISRKKRTIIVPTFEELVVQHCCVKALMPMFMRGMYYHSYGSIPNRGPHKAKRYIKKWIREDPKNCKYVLKMDIKHFFDTISHDVLKEMLARKIRDKDMLSLLFKIIDTTESGLPLGFYTSQWFANWYLEGLDHYIKEELKAVHYVRYMDDMVVFGSNKRKLHAIRKEIQRYLGDVLHLTLKENYQVYRFDYIRNGEHHGRDLDFMGFRFFRDRTIMRKSIMIKLTRKATKISRKEKPTIYDCRQFISYIGWLSHTDTYNVYVERVKPIIKIKKIKKRISNYERSRKCGS